MDRDEARTQHELAWWLALLRIPAVNNKLLHQLLGKFGSPEAIFALGRQDLASFGMKPEALDYIQSPDRARIRADLDWLAQEGHHLLTFAGPHYPALLKEIPGPPLALFVRGRVEALNALQIGVVGSRKPTRDGRRLAAEFGTAIVDCGVTVTSGLASGIDSCAHQGALSAQGTTVAALGHGLDMVYPAAHRKLAESIAETGALVSEYPLGYKPLPYHFPARNRIISGLSLGVLVVEAAAKSGSLITARHAMEQGREVFAIPGSIRNPMSEGCHALIRDGAKLVSDMTHILEEIGALANFVVERGAPEHSHTERINKLDAQAKLLLDNIGYEPTSIDELVEMTGLPVNTLTAELLRLEMLNRIESLAGGSYIRR